MAEQTFGTESGELLVVADGDTVGFITRGHDREDLDHDEVRKLIAFLQDIVGLSVDQLDALEPGREVVDREGQVWKKMWDENVWRTRYGSGMTPPQLASYGVVQ